MPPKPDDGLIRFIGVNYCLIYGISETSASLPLLGARVNYYLVYGTSETERQRVAHRRMVNYYLDYRTSETL